MEQIIYIKYGELNLKGNNKNFFINTLFKNIKKALKDFIGIKIIKEHDNIKIYNCKNYNEIINILKFVPGIDLIILGTIINRDIQKLKLFCLDLIDKYKTFKIQCKRKDKSFYLNSDQIIREVASHILKNKNNIFVDVHNPEILVSIEVNQNNFIVYNNKIKGIGGFPVGVNSKGLVLLSGGIDSPVAGYLLQKKGMNIDYITFVTPPYTSEKALDKTKDLIKIITLEGKIQNSKLYIINYTQVLHELNHVKNESYRITLMRRSFFRIASKIAKFINAKVIATGESIGQVASQTIESMETISNSINDILIYRPLLAMDKKEIIEIAKKIGTYDISIKPYDDSCSIFAPKKPTTKPNINNALKYESELFMLKTLEENIIKKMKERIKNE